MRSPLFDARYKAISELADRWLLSRNWFDVWKAVKATMSYSLDEQQLIKTAIQLGMLEKIDTTPKLLSTLDELSEELRLESRSSRGFARAAIWALAIITERVSLDLLNQEDEVEQFPFSLGILLSEQIRTALTGALIEIADGDYEGPFSFNRAITITATGKARLYSKSGPVVVSEARDCVLKNLCIESNGDSPAIIGAESCGVILQDCFIDGNAGNVRTIGTGWHLPKDVQVVLDEDGNGRTFFDIRVPGVARLALEDISGTVVPNELSAGGSTVCIEIRQCLFQSQQGNLLISTDKGIQGVPVGIRRRNLTTPQRITNASHGCEYPVPLQLLPKGRSDVMKLAQDIGVPTQIDETAVLREILGASPIKAQIRRREDRYDKWTVEFAIDPESMSSKAGATLSKNRQCLLLSTNISQIDNLLKTDSPCLCWLIQRKGSGLLIPDGGSRAWQGSFDCGGYGVPHHSLIETIRSIQPPLPDQILQLDAWNAFLEVEMAEAMSSQFYVYGKHIDAGGIQLRLKIDITTACLSESRLAEPDFWSRLKAAVGQELVYSTDAQINPDAVFKLGTLDSADSRKQIVTIRLTEENVEQLDKGSIDMPSSFWIGYQALGDVTQIERKKFGLSQFEKGNTKNPRLGLFFFDAQKARLPNRRVVLSEHEMLLGTKVNPEQKIAVEKALSSSDLMLIQGPPGTGKTTVIAEICYQMAKQGKRCLVASQTNLAVDNALFRLEHHPVIRAIRAGNVSRLEEEGRRFSESEVIRTWLGHTSKAAQRRLLDLRHRLNSVEQLLGAQTFLETLSRARAETKEADINFASELDALHLIALNSSKELTSLTYQIAVLSNAVDCIDGREIPEAFEDIPRIPVDWSLEYPYIRATDTLLRSLGRDRPTDIFDILRAGQQAQEWLNQQDIANVEPLAFDQYFASIRDAFERCQVLRAETHGTVLRHQALTERLARIESNQLALDDWKDAETHLDYVVSQLAQRLLSHKLLSTNEGLLSGLLELSLVSDKVFVALKQEIGTLQELLSLRAELDAAESECAESRSALQTTNIHNNTVENLHRTRAGFVAAIDARQSSKDVLTQSYIDTKRRFDDVWRHLQILYAVAHQGSSPEQVFDLARFVPVMDSTLESALQSFQRQATAYLNGYVAIRKKTLSLQEAVSKQVAEASKLNFVPMSPHNVPIAVDIEVQVNELARALRRWTERGFQFGIRRLFGRRDAHLLRDRVQSTLAACERYLATPQQSLEDAVGELHEIWKSAKDAALQEAGSRLSWLEQEIADSQVELQSIEVQLGLIGSTTDRRPIEREIERGSAKCRQIQILIHASLASSSDETQRWLRCSNCEWPKVILRLIDEANTKLSLLLELPEHELLVGMKASCLSTLVATTISDIVTESERLAQQAQSIDVESLRLCEARALIRGSLNEGFSDACLWLQWRSVIVGELQALEAQIARADERRYQADAKSKVIVEQIKTLHQDRAELEQRWEDLRANIPDLVLDVAPNRVIEDPDVLIPLFPKLGEERNRLEAVRQRDEQLLERWSHRLNSLTDAEERELHDLYVSNANVVGITCVQAGAKRFKLKYGHFDLIIVDEVSKATPPELLLPSLMGDKIVLIGDTMQLPPLIGQETFKEVATRLKKPKAELAFVEKSLFKELWSQLPDDDERKHRLTVQYRMHPQICQAIQQFYDHKLSNGPDVSKRSHSMQRTPFLPERHFLWIDMPKAEPFYEVRDGLSFANVSELRVISDVLIRINADFADTTIVKKIGIITFYAAQLKRIRELVDRLDLPHLSIRIGTVDRFQGMEREIVLVSLVRNNPGRSVGFAERPERLNVALSRAQELLVVIGSQSHFSQAVECGDMYAEVANTARAYDGQISGDGYST